ncbi:putative nucleic acid-binding protein with PIN domain and Zn ribbon [Aciduliprofundum sp. MAR08-339]|uniref:NOB1 family endonuclease n=1 Tax=Aciduliprofundum sp. (strain MAR08-339) TaxID=673860 RepID=UPI0002A4B4DA|nr:putative nucleic acid-binding protein with PIN domain and Zn ribbon [Aciduliprofundum sp. MAR08-339]
MKRYVIDSSALIEGFIPPGDVEIYTTPGVESEVKSKGVYFPIIKVVSPSRYNTKLAVKAAKETGDFHSLSNVDIELIALALQLNATLITDDYAMQNVASHLNLEFMGIHQDEIKEIRRWKWRCTSCGRYYSKYYSSCPVCGGELNRVRKSGKRR